jgi:lysophospholipase L1-like esterase
LHDINRKKRITIQPAYARRTQGLYLLLLLCLCVLALSACGHNVSSTPAQRTQQQSQSTDQVYVAIGASDTFGIGTRDPYSQNWPTDLATLLKQPVHLINLGIPGITLHDALTSELPIALDAHPTLVTVWLAVNDLAAYVPVNSYKHDLETLLSRVQAAAPHARIAVGNVPDLSLTSLINSYNGGLGALNQQTALYNAAIASVVASHHTTLVDLSSQGYNLRQHPEYLSGDGLHPSDLGYFELARLFYEALRKA